MGFLFSWVPILGQLQKKAWVSALFFTLLFGFVAFRALDSHRKSAELHRRLARVAPGTLVRVLKKERKEFKERTFALGLGLVFLAMAQALMIPPEAKASIEDEKPVEPASGGDDPEEDLAGMPEKKEAASEVGGSEVSKSLSHRSSYLELQNFRKIKTKTRIHRGVSLKKNNRRARV